MSSAESDAIIEELLYIHGIIRGRVEERLEGFRRIWESGNERNLFIELAFCILTPQSGARRCGHALDVLLDKGLLFHGSSDEISREINTVRFRHRKARYLEEARNRFMSIGESIRELHLSYGNDPRETRRWMAEHVKGIGYKEASHFLRNVGIGENLAILDRHILRNMVKLGLIPGLPPSISPLRYLDIERLLGEFAAKIGISMGHIDFVLWYRETGDIFK